MNDRERTLNKRAKGPKNPATSCVRCGKSLNGRAVVGCHPPPGTICQHDRSVAHTMLKCPQCEFLNPWT